MLHKYYKLLGVTILLILSGSILFINHEAGKSTNTHVNYKPPTISRPHGGAIAKEPAALPNEWMGYQRTYPYGKINHQHYLQAMRQAEMQHKNSVSRNTEWELLGPTNIGGRITDLIIDSENPGTIYIGAASGGIYKTINNGMSWQQMFHQVPVISIGDLAIDPQNAEVLYAGTGEANASSYSFLGDGIWKSVNGGIDWIHSGLEESAYIARIIVDHSNSNRIFAAACGTLFSSNSQRGVYRSLDGGTEWERVLFLNDSTAAIDLVQHPVNPDILYAAMWERVRGLNYRKSGGESSGIWKTTDGGDTWSELNFGLPDGANVGRIGLAMSTSDPNTLYAFYDKHLEENEDYSFLGIYKTTNGGVSWLQTNDQSIYAMNSRFGWYFGQVRVDPDNPDRVFALGVDLVRTENGGESWETIAGYFNTNEIHVDHHALEFDPNTNRMFVGNDGGLYYSENYGNSWSHINNVPLTQFYAIEVDYQNPHRIYGGTQDNNTIRTMTGELNDWHSILGGDGFYTLVNPTNSDIIFAEYQWGNLYRSTNGGDWMDYIGYNWQEDRTNWSSPLVMDPQNPTTLYFGTYRVWKTINNGSEWNIFSDDLTMGDDGSSYHTITTLAVSPHNSNHILAGTDDGRVHFKTGNLSGWQEISAGLPNRWITRVAFDPFHENRMYVTLSGFRWEDPLPHIFRSEDLGGSWMDISSNLPELPINCIVLDPQQEGHIYIGTDSGIFFTSNGGTSWQSYSLNLPNLPIMDLKIHQPTRKLIVGTYGASAYSLALDNFLMGDVNFDS
ncbi:MAG: hypothetical protein QGF57_01245, partial [Candidatus Marinimicrobia bacterium]|nr:hypothetical protein [Candidatus Neomarinimicrobiota bacterium]